MALPVRNRSIASSPPYAQQGTSDRGEALRSWRALPLSARLPTALWWIALTIALVYLAVFAVRLGHTISELTWNSDYASGFTLPETLVRTGTGGHVVLGAAAEWVPLWFGLATARLPLHRELWEIMPTLLFLASAALVGWSVSRVADRRAALLAVLLAVVASPLALAFLMAPVAHNTVYPFTALLGAYLIWLTRADARRRLTTLLVPAVLGLALGVCLASDQLLIVTAAIPLGLAAVLAGLQRTRRSSVVCASALITLAVSIPVAALTSSSMESTGYVKVASPIKVVAVSELADRLRLLFDGLKTLFNGYLTGRAGLLHTPLGIASDVVMSAALLTLLVLGVAGVAKLIRSAWPGARARTPAELARSLHVVYWAVSAATTCGAFWIAAETGGGTVLHEAYYGTVIFSVAAVVPLLLSSGTLARWLIPIGAGVFFAGSLAGLTSDYTNISPRVARYGPQIAKVAQLNHVTSGYGSYGEAAAVTWHTHGRVTMRPVMECESPTGASICQFYLVSVPSWYVPQQRRTFLLVDPEEPWVRAAPNYLGKPVAAYAIGPLAMYVYPYDIASRLGPPPY